MSFSAATCLTFTAETQLGPTLYFFSDADNYTTSFGSAPTIDLVSPNCPFIITGITDGATIIRLRDYVSGCCIDIPIQPNNLCTICNISFDVLEGSTSLITAGNLDSTCLPEPTDYVVYWYGPNSTTNIGYTSGLGTIFDYQFSHPLTGTSAIFAQSGTYTPVIDKIIVDGTYFSQSASTGFFPANLSCFSPISVGALRCDNGNQPTSAYTHYFSFSGASQGLPSPPLESTFELSANTNYFAWKFRGFTIPDQFIVSYSGANYPTPIVVDNTVVGDAITSGNLTWTTYQKSADTSSDLSRVICLTGITRSPGNEVLILRIVPSTGATNWQMSLNCMETFDCSKCTDDYLNQPYKIILSSLTAKTYNSQNVQVNDFSASCYTKVTFDVSGCSSSGIVDTDFFKYFQQSQVSNHSAIFSNAYSSNGILSQGASDELYLGQSECFAYGNGSTSLSSLTCAASDPTSTITYTKYVSGASPNQVGVIYIEFNQSDDLSAFYNNYNTEIQSNSTWGFSGCTTGATPGSVSGLTFAGGTGSEGRFGPFSGGTSINGIPSYLDNTDQRYYRHLWLSIPTATGSTNCNSDAGGRFVGNQAGGLVQSWRIHPSSIITTGTTGPNYYLQIIMNKVSYGLTAADCAINCTGFSKNMVDNINFDSTGSTNNITATTQTGSYFTNPFRYNYAIALNCNANSGYTKQGYVVISEWSNNTLPFSSSTSPLYTNSAVTCNVLSTFQYLFRYDVSLLNNTSTDFNISGYTLSNGSYGSYELVASYVGGVFTYTNPTFVIT